MVVKDFFSQFYHLCLLSFIPQTLILKNLFCRVIFLVFFPFLYFYFLFLFFFSFLSLLGHCSLSIPILHPLLPTFLLRLSVLFLFLLLLLFLLILFILFNFLRISISFLVFLVAMKTKFLSFTQQQTFLVTVLNVDELGCYKVRFFWIFWGEDLITEIIKTNIL